MGLFRGVELSGLTLSGDRLDLRGRAVDEAGREHGTALGSAIVERSSGRVVGSAVLDLGPGSAAPAVAFSVVPDARGHAYAAEAVRLLAEWAYGVGVRRVELACDVGNLAAVRTAMAAGFGFEGVAREAGPASTSAADGSEAGGSRGDGHRADVARFARLADDPGEPVPPSFPPLVTGGHGDGALGTLGDGVISVRAARPSDAQGFLDSDDEVSRSWAFTDHARTHADATRTVTQAGLLWLVGRMASCAIVDVATGRYAGEIQLREAGPPRTGSFGYQVHPDFRGRGYTTRALRLLVPWAFEVADLARLGLGAKRGNIASQRAAASAGFLPDGTRERRLLNVDGSFADEIQFALVNPRYR